MYVDVYICVGREASFGIILTILFYASDLLPLNNMSLEATSQDFKYS